MWRQKLNIKRNWEYDIVLKENWEEQDETGSPALKYFLVYQQF